MTDYDPTRELEDMALALLNHLRLVEALRADEQPKGGSDA